MAWYNIFNRFSQKQVKSEAEQEAEQEARDIYGLRRNARWSQTSRNQIKDSEFYSVARSCANIGTDEARQIIDLLFDYPLVSAYRRGVKRDMRTGRTVGVNPSIIEPEYFDPSDFGSVHTELHDYESEDYDAMVAFTIEVLEGMPRGEKTIAKILTSELIYFEHLEWQAKDRDSFVPELNTHEDLGAEVLLRMGAVEELKLYYKALAKNYPEKAFSKLAEIDDALSLHENASNDLS